MSLLFLGAFSVLSCHWSPSTLYLASLLSVSLAPGSCTRTVCFRRCGATLFQGQPVPLPRGDTLSPCPGWTWPPTSSLCGRLPCSCQLALGLNCAGRGSSGDPMAVCVCARVHACQTQSSGWFVSAQGAAPCRSHVERRRWLAKVLAAPSSQWLVGHKISRK